MKKEQYYPGIKFNPSVLRKVVNYLSKDSETQIHLTLGKVADDQETWHLDTLEEFYDAYAKSPDCHFMIDFKDKKNTVVSGLRIYQQKRHLSVEVTNSSREEIAACFNVIEDAIKNNEFVKTHEDKSDIKIFIGHGRSDDWKYLKDHLREKHGYEIIAYEVGARTGHSIRDILSDMLDKSTFACLVLTPEDETKEEKLLARQNVIHETGLFQGRLGFNKAIVLLKEGTEEFSNLSGIQQIRYKNINEAFGDVLATLKREFG